MMCSRRRLGPLVDDDMVGQGYHIQQSRSRGASKEVNDNCCGLVWSSNEYLRLILARFGARVSSLSVGHLDKYYVGISTYGLSELP